MNKKKKTVIIGITGSLGTGKTTAAGIFKKLGAAVLDADKIAREVLEKNTACYKKTVKAFGRRILDADGKIDRKKLAGLAFSGKRNVGKLCGITHPAIIKKIKKSVGALSGSRGIPAIVIDAPLLIEAGLHKTVDILIVVKVSRGTQIERAVKKNRLSGAEASRRIRNQMPLGQKARMADYILDNEGNRGRMTKEIKKIWEGIKSDRGQ